MEEKTNFADHSEIGASTPDELFELWYAQAQEAMEHEPYTMVLSTVLDGKVDARVVYMKRFEKGKIYFFTNYESQKAKSIDQNNHVSLLFYHVLLQRQIRIQGVCKKTSPEISDAYFATRSRESQIGAWVSAQSRPIAHPAILREKWRKMCQENKVLSRPDHWGGYEVEWERVEFWQAGAHRLHERLLFEKSTQGWKKTYLAP